MGAPKDTALFVRIPAGEAEKLDRAAFELKARKRDLVTALLARYVDPSTSAGLEALRGLGVGRPPAASAEDRRVVVETGAEPVAVGRHEFRPFEPPEVLTLEQLADLLQAPADEIVALARSGALPGREIGGHWRFARKAILDWLADPSG